MSELLIIGLIAVFAWFSFAKRPSSRQQKNGSAQGRLADLWDLSRDKMKERKFLQAEKALLAILKIDETNAAAYNRIGILYARQKEYENAINCFEIASTIDRTPGGLNNLGHIYFETEQYEKAAIAFKKVLELDDKLASRYISYAKALQRLGRETEVLSALEKAVELEANHETLNMLFGAYLKLDMTDQAIEVQAKLKKLSKTTAKPTKRPHRAVAPSN